MNKEPAFFERRRRSTIGGCCRVPVIAVVLALGLAPGAGNAKFCGIDLYNNPGVSSWGRLPLKNLQPFHDSLDRLRLFDDYVRRSAGTSGYSGFILWGYRAATGFKPLYFVPSNVASDSC